MDNPGELELRFVPPLDLREQLARAEAATTGLSLRGGLVAAPEALQRWASLIKSVDSDSGHVSGSEWAHLLGARRDLNRIMLASEFYGFSALLSWLVPLIDELDERFRLNSSLDPDRIPQVAGAANPAMWWARRIPNAPAILNDLPTGATLVSLSKPDVFPPLPERVPVPKEFVESNATGSDFRGRTLAGLNLAGVDFRNCDMSGADLSGADLVRSNLQGAKLVGADLSGANLSYAELDGADLSGCSAEGLVALRARFRASHLVQANLRNAVCRSSSFLRADLGSAVLISADLDHADLFGASLVKADLTGAVLSGANVANASFVGAELTGAVVEGIRRKGHTHPEPPLHGAKGNPLGG